MAWGRLSIPVTPPPPKFVLVKLLPLFILLLALAILAFVGYYLYLSVQQISSAATAKLKSKHVSFSKDGVRVGVKELKNESYVDKTQGFLVKTWNLSTWPAYKSRLWNKQQSNAAAGTSSEGAKGRKPYTNPQDVSNT